jgi:adenosylcobinamide-GDP ribazoletransferase
MKKELRTFFTALMFYTRIPCPKDTDHSAEYLNRATRYLPLIGILVGAASAGVFYLSQLILPVPVSLIFAILTGIWITGAFHEDGLADVCDGFGGGWTAEKILLIMKDSRVGAYGAIGLILVFFLKISLLSSLPLAKIPFVLIAAHALSRLVALSFIFSHDYARADETSKVKPVAKKSHWINLVFAAILGIAPLLLFQSAWVFLVLIPLLILKWYLGRYFKKWIGGYTGDCMGATQQISEVIIYLGLLIVWKYT